MYVGKGLDTSLDALLRYIFVYIHTLHTYPGTCYHLTTTKEHVQTSCWLCLTKVVHDFLLHQTAQRKIRSYHIADMGHGCISILQSNVSHKWIKICLKCIHSQILKGADRKTPPFTVGLERFQWYNNNIDQKQIKVSQNEGTPSPFVETRINHLLKS